MKEYKHAHVKSFIADIIPYSYISHDFEYMRLKNIKFLNSSVKTIYTSKNN